MALQLDPCCATDRRTYQISRLNIHRLTESQCRNDDIYLYLKFTMLFPETRAPTSWPLQKKTKRVLVWIRSSTNTIPSFCASSSSLATLFQL